MTKFKLTIVADVELGVEEAAEYAKLTQELRSEYIQNVISGMKSIVESEMPDDMERIVVVTYEEVSE